VVKADRARSRSRLYRRVPRRLPALDTRCEDLLMTEVVVVRDGVEDDLDQLTAIYNHYVVSSPATFDIEPFTIDQRRADWFRHYGAAGPHRLFVAAVGPAILGYATSSPFRPKPAYSTTVETSVYCAPGATGRGVGSLLYGQLFRALVGLHLHRAMAGVTLPNDASLALHRAFGFVEIGTEHEVGRKFDTYWDVKRLERPLE
jgi:phosphinothricin acetyltransferase